VKTLSDFFISHENMNVVRF